MVSHISETHRKSVQSGVRYAQTDVSLHEINDLGRQPQFVNINNCLLQLNADRDAFKGSTDTPQKATQDECDLKPSKMVPKPALMATCEDGEKKRPKGTSYLQIGEDVSIESIY